MGSCQSGTKRRESRTSRIISLRSISSRTPGAGLAIKKILQKTLQLIFSAEDDLHQFVMGFGRGKILFEHLNRTAHGGERISDLMRKSGGHLADEGKPPALFQRFPHFVDFRQILENDDLSDC